MSEELDKAKRAIEGAAKSLTVNFTSGAGGVERRYAAACEKYRTIHNSIEGNPHISKLKRKYRAS